ncbi:phosphoribosyl-ATP diphosphatase [Croceicoccus marinus]|jgi:phosphoribosyl-ATP pyrophosphohydrolase|uniref:Phosphoribosyl-ATP pyrophosphatase n=1 Tax=Croceicoccus marinus TaxID=450378 RepID=A0A1Z1FC97_9SPHN|nr:phosphoribosyl-ATP diphosphatase [Croceicoccus marinus]ARU16336.1 phosphoribosyl-ATP diphosphatase [Croceicoccus marinus]QNE06255.1 phosphoribosyl-ATP diphosphatase [Croceicoccus marinus]
MTDSIDIITRLAATIETRKGGDPNDSYVAKLFDRGPDYAARKLGEEAVETVVAALAGSDEELVGEAADVIFHLSVLLSARDLSIHDALAELGRREGVSGIEEKNARSSQGN